MIERGDKRVPAAKIECTRCGSVAYHSDTGLNDDVYFSRKGWRVGNGPAADVCPGCQQKSKPDLKVVKNMEPMKAEAPREMSREDRRIVFAKIDELYLDDRSGYAHPWTDAAVARDLGVPRAWVAQVRDELFGPEGSNADYDEFLEKAAPVIAELKNLNKSAQAQLDQARAIAGKVDELERMAKRIEKEIGR